MDTIVRIPKTLSKAWFMDLELRHFFTKPQWNHFRSLVLAFVMTSSRHTILGLDRILAFGPHRTKRRDFAVVAPWDAQAVLRHVCYRTLRHLGLQPGQTIDFVIDDSHAKKRGKKMQGLGKYRDISTMAFIWGHNFIVGGFYYRGSFIPYDLRLALKPSWCRKLERAFQTLPDLAAAMIRSLSVAREFGVKVRVLFDAGYMNRKVVSAVVEQGWDFFSTLPGNRAIKVRGRWTPIKEYRRCIPYRQYRAVACKTDHGDKTYWATSRTLWLKSIGKVKVVFSRRTWTEKALPLVSNDRTLSKKEIIEIYSRRWAIECFFKSGRQILGLGEYQTRSAEGIEKHLRLVGIVYSLLVQEGQDREAGERTRTMKRTQGLDPLSLMRAREDVLSWSSRTCWTSWRRRRTPEGPCESSANLHAAGSLPGATGESAMRAATVMAYPDGRSLGSANVQNRST
jgi:SRSO17 transposase